MSRLKIARVSALSTPLVANTIYLLQVSDSELQVVTVGNTAADVRSSIIGTDVDGKITASVGALNTTLSQAIADAIVTASNDATAKADAAQAAAASDARTMAAAAQAAAISEAAGDATNKTDAALAAAKTYTDDRRNGLVETTTGPGGGIGLSAGNTPLWLQGVSLLDRVPLPTIRSIADPENMDIANAVLTDGVSLSWVDEPNERHGRALEITIPGAVTNKWVQIPLKPNWDGNYPKTTSAVQFRLRLDEAEPITVLMPWVAESIGSNSASRVGYLVSVRGGTDRQGWKGTFAARWNGRYRNYAMPNALISKQQSPADWSRATPEYETRAIIFSITTTGPAKFRFSRAYSEEWPVAGVVTQFDGAYLESQPFMQKMLDLRWPCVASINGYGTASADDEFLRTCIRAGWDLIQHVSNSTQTVPPESGVIDGTMTDADLRRVTAAWSRALQSRGLYTDRGRAAVSHLQNNSPRGVANAVSVYRDMGVRTARGFCPDNEWGIDIGDGLTTQYPSRIWSGWASLNGRYNRRMAVASARDTPEERHIYSGSLLEEVLLNTIAAKEMTWFYFHRLQAYAPPTYPEVSQSSHDFAESWKQHMIEEERAGRVVMLTASQVDLLTYDRPGDVYLRWDGAWVSRSSATVEDERHVVL